MKFFKTLIFIALTALVFSCNLSNEEKSITSTPEEVEMKYTGLHDSITGISFKNVLKEDQRINYFTYEYMYMGGGVSIGDINNDGLPDLYFTGNRVENKLYLNKGNMKFEDISRKAGVQGDDRWYTGVNMVDINNDGLLDIYLSVSGKFTTTENQLFINNGDLSFTESSSDYGLNYKGPTVQSAFFDYDNDGDLDLYLANYPPTPFSSPNKHFYEKMKDPKEEETDRLYRNDGNKKFVDVTKEAGIWNFGLGLSTAISDYNKDGYLDVYVSNDLISPDFLYINQGDGTFTEELDSYTQHTAQFGMGTDVADINNDGLMDIMQLDMMAEDNKKQKTSMASMNPPLFYEAIDLGMGYQYMRNCLQINNGNGTFSDIAELAGVDATDWSWAALLMDMDNDGWKDMFVSNGVRRNVNDKDYMKSLQKRQKKGEIDLTQPLILVQEMPEDPVNNYTYKNNGDLTFAKKINEWGIDFEGYTNGVAYGDLDLDGDLDLVLNNLDEKAIVYKNNASSRKDGNYLTIKLRGKQDNYFGLGASVYVKSGNLEQWQEMMPVRGFQSSVEPILHFGLGENQMVDELNVRWLNGSEQKMTNVKAGQMLEIIQNGTSVANKDQSTETNFTNVSETIGIDFKHIENKYDDFVNEVLLPHKMSQFGPGIAVADINGDNLEDFFVGGALGKAGAIYIQSAEGKFSKKVSSSVKADQNQEDIDALFFDLENDGDMDLYVVSGGNEFAANAPELQDRIYINDGKGNFKKAIGVLPEMFSSGGCVAANDFDGDGDQDLFVGGRLVPAKYPFPARSYLLQNNEGVFTDITANVAPDLVNAGMVTSALWTDFNGDNTTDLVVTGEWMPIRFFEQKESLFTERTNEFGFENTTGWWFSLAAADMDNDGDEDYVAGNLGLNYKYQGTVDEPFHVYADDFDENGSMDIVLGFYNNGKAYPVRGLQCSSEQIPSIKDKFKTYDAFGEATLDKVYGTAKLNTALHYEAKQFASCYIENLGNGKFKISQLHNLAQISSVNSILLHDVDNDGAKDIILAGNMHESEVETPRNDAGVGLWLQGNGSGEFTPVPTFKSGFYAPNVVNDMKMLQKGEEYLILLGNNNDRMQSFVFPKGANQTSER